jgi:hypothetical protein
MYFNSAYNYLPLLLPTSYFLCCNFRTIYRYRVRIYRVVVPARQSRICKHYKKTRNRFPAWNWFLASLNVYKYGLRLPGLAESIPWSRFLKTLSLIKDNTWTTMFDVQIFFESSVSYLFFNMLLCPGFVLGLLLVLIFICNFFTIAWCYSLNYKYNNTSLETIFDL